MQPRMLLVGRRVPVVFFLIAGLQAACGPDVKGTQTGSPPRQPFSGELHAEAPAASVTANPSQAPGKGCIALREFWVSQTLDDEARSLLPEEKAELDERARQMRCPLRLDLDGDGRVDEIHTGKSGDRLTLEIFAGDGTHLSFGAGQALLTGEYRESERTQFEDDFSWVWFWDVAVREVNAQGKVSLVRGRPFEIEDAQGDGLFLSSGDVALILYKAPEGFVLLELGF